MPRIKVLRPFCLRLGRSHAPREFAVGEHEISEAELGHWFFRACLAEGRAVLLPEEAEAEEKALQLETAPQEAEDGPPVLETAPEEDAPAVKAADPSNDDPGPVTQEAPEMKAAGRKAAKTTAKDYRP